MGTPVSWVSIRRHAGPGGRRDVDRVRSGVQRRQRGLFERVRIRQRQAVVWRFHTGAPIWGAPPITYMLEGHQWVVVPSGVTITAFALPDAVRESGSQGRRPGPPRVEPN